MRPRLERETDPEPAPVEHDALLDARFEADASPPSAALDMEDEQQVVGGARLPARLVFEIVRRDGVEELERPIGSLAWSGIAAGLLISFSVLGMAVLRTHLPPADWRPLIESFGYTFGFLLTILGRMQLFTENTITTIIPLCRGPSLHMLAGTVRLWTVVLGANLVGTFAGALFIARSGAFEPELLNAVRNISMHMMDRTTGEMFFRAVPAGVLIAAIVWLLPSSAGTGFWVILVFTYFIALAGFTHVVAGATEANFLLLVGEVNLSRAFFHFLLPVLAGNVVGGTAVFALLAYAQVRREV
jgi:formate-nitrite transporter family protein